MIIKHLSTALMLGGLATLTLAGCATPPAAPAARFQTHAFVGGEPVPCEEIVTAAGLMMTGRQIGEEQEFFADNAAHTIANPALYRLMMEILDTTYSFPVRPTDEGKATFIIMHEDAYRSMCQSGKLDR